jgi:hypothetical protein
VLRLIPGEEKMEKFLRPVRFDTDPTMTLKGGYIGSRHFLTFFGSLETTEESK